MFIPVHQGQLTLFPGVVTRRIPGCDLGLAEAVHGAGKMRLRPRCLLLWRRLSEFASDPLA